MSGDSVAAYSSMTETDPLIVVINHMWDCELLARIIAEYLADSRIALSWLFLI